MHSFITRKFSLASLFGITLIGSTLCLPAPARADLLNNGNFSAGYSGFQTNYTQVATDHTVSTVPPDYALITDPSVAFPNGFLSYGDHTSGTGLMLFADGSTNSSQAFWRETISLSVNTSYTFTYFVTGADSESLPHISLLVNGTPIDSGFQVTGSGGGANWQKVTENFTTSAAGPYTIAMIDLNTINVGNDFTVDDLSLTAAVPEPRASLLLLAGGALIGVGIVQRRRKAIL